MPGTRGNIVDHLHVAVRVASASINSGAKDHKPSPAAMIEARKARAAADRDPLRYAFGDPLPGRSALDKMKTNNT